jgi:activator of 2-hydroxyglutaryl-CoA dehydratase
MANAVAMGTAFGAESDRITTGYQTTATDRNLSAGEKLSTFFALAADQNALNAGVDGGSTANKVVDKVRF